MNNDINVALMIRDEKVEMNKCWNWGSGFQHKSEVSVRGEEKEGKERKRKGHLSNI